MIAVTGGRGWGKSTLLGKIKEELERTSGERNVHYIVTRPIDVATIHPDLGILPRAVQALYELAGQQPVNHLDPPFLQEGRYHNKLDKLYEEVSSLAMLHADSQKDIAREMAISPDQYTRLLRQQLQGSGSPSKSFSEFIQVLTERVSASQKKHGQCIPVVLLDDIDLAEPEMVRKWARNFSHEYRDTRVIWILVFDRSRMTAMLSNPRLDDPNILDLSSGKSLLSKLVPFARQYNLATLGNNEKFDFVPFYSSQSRTEMDRTGEHFLGKLLEGLGLQNLLFLVPNNYRDLKAFTTGLKPTSKRRRTILTKRIGILKIKRSRDKMN